MIGPYKCIKLQQALHIVSLVSSILIKIGSPEKKIIINYFIMINLLFLFLLETENYDIICISIDNYY